jgi:hypothetical protein
MLCVPVGVNQVPLFDEEGTSAIFPSATREYCRFEALADCSCVEGCDSMCYCGKLACILVN